MDFASTLLAWYEENKRALPWRGERDPYKIWVSEIILQQTRVQQGWDYYLRFVETFPNIQSLAEATEEQVLLQWQGLGYYTRARNLYAAARQIMQEHHGKFPEHYDDIRQLKGVGDYTAAAIASIAFGLPYPAVDGNVLRIISRIFGVCDDISLPATRKAITEICLQNFDPDHPGTYNQACMEFGAIHCTPKNPSCHNCPFHKQCYALQHDMTGILPVKNRPTPKRDRYFHYYIYMYKNTTLLEKRTARDIWRNLYQFPLLETENDETLAGDLIGQTREVLSHQVIHARFYLQRLQHLPEPEPGQIRVRMEEIRQYPLPKTMVMFLSRMDF